MKRLLLISLFFAVTPISFSKEMATEIQNGVTPVSDTTWSGKDIFGQPISLYFGADGKLAYKANSGVFNNASWRQSGENIYFEINNRFVEHQGKISGNQMHGEGQSKRGRKSTWSAKKLPSNINGLKIAHATTLSPPSKYYKFLPKQAYLGVYETSIPDRNAGKTIITLTCENKIGCKIETARIKEGEYPHTNHNGKRYTPKPFHGWRQLQLSIDYARLSRGFKPTEVEMADIQAKLMPYLETSGTVEGCIALGSAGVCKPAEALWNKPTLILLQPMLTKCTQSFCGYMFIPLIKSQN